MPRPALVVFWTSLAVLVAAVVFLGVTRWQLNEESEIQAVGTRPDFSSSPSPSPSPSPAVLPSSTGPTPSPTVTYDIPSTPVYVTAPMSIRIPAIEVDTRILPVGIQKDGAIEIPEDVRYVGWYKLGVPPGVDRGSAVLVAHRDGQEQGRGVFYELGTLKPGDPIYLTTEANEFLPYQVVSREAFVKRGLPLEELFAVDGKPRLTLLSCGGAYDPDKGGYQDNIVVTAVPMFEPKTVKPADPNAKPSYAPTPSATNASASPSPSPSPSPTASKQPKPQTFSNKPTKKATPTPTPTPLEPTPTPLEPTPETSPSPGPSISSDEPVSVAVPGAGTIEESSTPVLLGGSG